MTIAQHSPSFLMNNLTTNGEYFAFANSTEGGPKAVILGREVLEKDEVQVPAVAQWKDQSDCFALKYLLFKGKWYLAVLTAKGCQLYNPNCTRQLAYIESKKKVADGKVNFFTSATVGFDKTSGEEFIAVGTCTGEIYQVQLSGASFVKEIGFQMSDSSAVTALSGDQRSRHLAAGNSNGYVIIFETDNENEWKPSFNVGTADEIPVTAL